MVLFLIAFIYCIKFGLFTSATCKDLLLPNIIKGSNSVISWGLVMFPYGAICLSLVNRVKPLQWFKELYSAQFKLK